jgi:sirohydrochlorin cobaltochelatase
MKECRWMGDACLNIRNDKGVLVICHGSNDPAWVRMTHTIVQKAALPVPTIVSFLEASPDRGMLSIQEGISQLVKMGLVDILVIPMFLSSFTTHLDEIRSLLGVDNVPPYVRTVCPIEPTCTVQYCEPLDDHPIVAQILMERIQELMSDSKEPVVLIAHGVNDSKLYPEYEQMLIQIIQQIQHHYQSIDTSNIANVFKTADRSVPAIHFATFYPDTIRHVVESIQNQNTPIIIPLFLSEGFFTKHKIPAKLNGFQYKYSGKALLPNPEIASWLQERVRPFLYFLTI